MRPLCDALEKMKNNLSARFFMPSHSGVGEGILSAADYDMTEIEGLDNLLQADGVIRESETLMAQSYKCKCSLMLTEGSTRANHIAIAMLKNIGGSIVGLGKLHKSIGAACQLMGVALVSAADLDEVKDVFKANKSCVGVVVTSPDYFGNVIDLVAVRKLCDDYSKIMFVDGAHGAHFAFCELLPQGASEIADITSVSMHKTMNVYGGGALLNINNASLIESGQYFRALMHSTSPSYITLASMDMSRELFAGSGEKMYADVKVHIELFKTFVEKNLKDKVQIEHADDFSRLVISLNGADGYDCLSQLLKCGVGLEMAQLDKIVAIVTPFNCDKLPLLGECLAKVNLKKLQLDLPAWKGAKGKLAARSAELEEVDTKVNLRNSKIEFLSIDESIGRTLATDIGIYPPGVAIFKRGDILDALAIKIIKDFDNKVFGLVNNRIAVL